MKVDFKSIARLKVTMSAAMLCESIWTDRPKYEQAEAHYQRFLAGTVAQPPHGTEKKVKFKSYFLNIYVNFKLYILVHVHKESSKKEISIEQSNKRPP